MGKSSLLRFLHSEYLSRDESVAVLIPSGGFKRPFGLLKRICDEYLAGKYSIEVVDLMVNPRLAKEDQIVAIPTLVRKLPDPIRKIIGDLSDTERTLVGLQLRVKGAT